MLSHCAEWIGDGIPTKCRTFHCVLYLTFHWVMDQDVSIPAVTNRLLQILFRQIFRCELG